MLVRRYLIASVIALAMSALAVPRALANFHLMQIEQLIGGVEGDTSAQCIQLRMRAAGEKLVSMARVRVWDAAGLNPVIVSDLLTDVTNDVTGDRVLICTAAFLSRTSPTTSADFIMDNPIPASYMAAGRLTFEANNGAILWSVAWGGASYTGSNGGTSVNDPDANFGPAFPGPLPTTSLQSLLFQGSATAASSNNAADYALSSSPSVWINNARTSFTLQASCAAPAVTQSPDPGNDRVGRDFTFTVTATGTTPLSYQWRKDGWDLTDDSRIIGSQTAALTICPLELGDSGSYDVVVTNTCGQDTSDPATLAVFCPSDFDMNGFVNGEDFDQFVFLFEQGDPGADFDENTFVNGDDFDQFVFYFEAGC